MPKAFVFWAVQSTSAPRDIKIIFAFASIYIIWGSTYLGIYYAIQSIPPLMMAGIRFVVVGIIWYLITKLYYKESFNYHLWRFGAISGFLLFFIGNGAVVLAERHLPTGLVSILAGTVPFWLLIMDARSGMSRFKNPLTWLGLIIGFAGVFILFSDKINFNNHTPGLTSSLITMVIGAISWALGTLYSKYSEVRGSTLAKVSVQALTSGLFLLIGAAYTGEFSDFHFSQVTAVSWGALAYLILFGSMIGYFSYLWLLSKVSAHAVGTYAFVNPMVAVALGTLIAGELFVVREYIALIAIILGLVALYFSKKY
ncbi:MAG: EamA family transporter [Saprospiraceae bacterium]|nr:EamA family transporter [Saprospiraceae bacterium]